jgi:hypothetical protein
VEQESTQHLTSVAQHLRGIAHSIHMQDLNAEAIYDQLKERLNESDDNSLFDDERFTKSGLYYWTVKTYDELRESMMQVGDS